jgi:hypothetical protein
MYSEQASATIESLLHAVYEGISGKHPQWERLSRLFHPDARFIPPVQENSPVVAITFEQFRIVFEKSTAMLEPDQGFYERSFTHKIETFGTIAHVWSSFDTRSKPDDVEPCMRGINSFQFVRQDNRWWVLTTFWDFEREDNPIPFDYL